MKGKFLIFAALAFLHAPAQAAVGDTFEIDDLLYTVTAESESSNTVSVQNLPYKYSISGDIVIPATVTNEETTYSVTSIADKAFLYCSHIVSITIPASVNKIGEDVFSFCFDLSAINVAEDNPNFSSNDGVLYNKDRTSIIACPKAISGRFEIPASVTAIGNHCFHCCAKLTEIIIPEGVNSIGNYSFFGCSSLTTVNIPQSATINAGYSLFPFCTSLETITVEEGNQSVCSVDGVLYNAAMTQLMTYPAAKKDIIDIPESVTTYVTLSFFSCSALTSVTIPESVQSVGAGTFANCQNLIEINVDETNPKLSSSDGILYNKEQTVLNQFPGGRTGEYTVPDNVTSLRGSSFRGAALSSIVIPEYVKSVGISCFRDCKNLKSIRFVNPTPLSCDETCFYATPEDMVVYVPEGSVEAYRQAWPFVKNIEEFDEQNSAIEIISTDPAEPIDYARPVEIYDLSGQKLSSGLSGLTPGLYILRQDGHSEKIVIKQQ